MLSPEQRTPTYIQDGDLAALELLNLCGGPLFRVDLLAAMALYRTREKYNYDRVGLMHNSHQLFFGVKRYDPVIYRPVWQQDKKKNTDQHHPKPKSAETIYDYTASGKRLLIDAGRYHPISQRGWNEHRFANARIAAGIILGGLQDGCVIRPPEKIVKTALGVPVPYTTPNGTLITGQMLVPDHLLGPDQRSLALETDLGNEYGRPGQHTPTDDEEALYRKRKTYMRMILQYHALIGQGLYRKLYNIPKGLVLLFATTSEAKQRLFNSIIEEVTHGKGFNWACSIYIPPERVFSPFGNPEPLTHLWSAPWERVGNVPFYLDNPARQ